MTMQRIYDFAQRELGTKEIPGTGNNPRIVAYHESTRIGASDDSVPWCSSFVNWCVERAGYAGTGSPAARSWLNWGKELKKPTEGCVVVLRRGTQSWQGHVGFYVREDEDLVYLLGGNQGNSVSIKGFPKDKVLGFRRTMQVKDSKTVGTSMIGTIIAGAGAAIHTFPDEIIDNATSIGTVAGGFGENWKTGVIAFLVIIAFIYIARERVKKIDEKQI